MNVSAGDAEIRERAGRLHDLGVTATDDGRPSLAARRLRRGLALLGWKPDATGQAADPEAAALGWKPDMTGQAVGPEAAALLARMLTSLAHAEAEQGHTGLGMDLLDEAQRWASAGGAADRARPAWSHAPADGAYGRGLRELDIAAPSLVHQDGVELARVLLNRSVIHLMMGRARLAREDARRCARLATAHGHEVLAVKALHNNGYCDLLLGDIPTALARFGEVEQIYRRLIPGFLPVLALDQARALLAARRRGRPYPGRGPGRVPPAAAHAGLRRSGAGPCSVRAAREAFFRGGSVGAAGGGPLPPQAQPGLGPAGDADAPARGAGPDHRARAPARRGRPCLPPRRVRSAGRERDGLHAVGEGADRRRSPGQGGGQGGGARQAAPRRAAQVRLMRHLTEAELAHSRERRGQALRQVRTGLALIHTHRGRLGSLDMQTGVTALGFELAVRGLEAALANGSARLVFDWSERCRAQAFRYPPVRASQDEQTANALAELRHLAQQMHADETTSRP